MSNTKINKNTFNSIFQLWKLEELFTPSSFPKLKKSAKINKKEFPLDSITFYNDDSSKKLPLENYIQFNESLKTYKPNINNEKLYNSLNIYVGDYEINSFILTLSEKCRLDIENHNDLLEMRGNFYIFSINIDLQGNLTKFNINQFFYAIVTMVNEKNININSDILSDLNKLEKNIQDGFDNISKTEDINKIKCKLFKELKILDEKSYGLINKSNKYFVCKGLRNTDKDEDLRSFYIQEIDIVKNNYEHNPIIKNYVSALLRQNENKIMIDSDIDEIQKWLHPNMFPLAKYPSKFSPTLMQQVAINLATTGFKKEQNIFSVNGPPGTGKTTLLKEIIASNIEKQAEELLRFGIDESKFKSKIIKSTSNLNYTDIYYEIPDEIAKYGILVVSNNNGAAENISLELPLASEVTSNKTRTNYFDRLIHKNKDIYFSQVADQLLGEENYAWGLISARMGRKSYIDKVLSVCTFKNNKNNQKMITLDSAKENSISWDEAKAKFIETKNKVLKIRKQINEDFNVVHQLYVSKTKLINSKKILENLKKQRSSFIKKLQETRTLMNLKKAETLSLTNEISYIFFNCSFFHKILIFLHIGDLAKKIKAKKAKIVTIKREYENLFDNYISIANKTFQTNKSIANQNNNISNLNQVIIENEKYIQDNDLKAKYGDNFTNENFYYNIKESEKSQTACPWTYPDYDKAREELFYASLQVRKAFILNSKIIKRNLFVYQFYLNGCLNNTERKEIFSHLFNSLSIVIPVISSTFASVGRFLKDAGNKSLGTLIIDEAGQATPHSAIGALYRTKSAIVVGDPLQVEPVVTIPKVIKEILIKETKVEKQYGNTDLSVQSFADRINSYCGNIDSKLVGCPLVVHRRCVDPMFSISNMISYDNRMFNKTNLDPSTKFLLEKSGWIDIKGEENSKTDHFVKDQAVKVCELLEQALKIYNNLFEDYKKIFIISPFKTVVSSIKKYILDYFSEIYPNLKKETIDKWLTNCVGTVHTFQGKDANEVLFVLGCSSQSEGAMNWVVKKANILNVACTRAKYRIAFIGNIENWKNKKYFKDFIHKHIHIIEQI